MTADMEQWPVGTYALWILRVSGSARVVVRVDRPEAACWRRPDLGTYWTWQELWQLGRLERLYRPDEVAELVDAATGVERIGHHRVAIASGYCLECGVNHSPPEIERARQLAAQQPPGAGEH